MRNYTLAKLAYEAYKKSTEFIFQGVLQGMAIPNWEDLPPEIQDTWYEATISQNF